MWFYWLFWLSFRAECIKCFSSRLSVVSLQKKKNDIVSLALALNAEYGFIQVFFIFIYFNYLLSVSCSACMVEYSIAFSFLLVNFTIVLFCKRVETWCNVSLRTFFNYYLMASISAWHRNCLFLRISCGWFVLQVVYSMKQLSMNCSKSFHFQKLACSFSVFVFKKKKSELFATVELKFQ